MADDLERIKAQVKDHGFGKVRRVEVWVYQNHRLVETVEEVNYEKHNKA